MNIRLGQYLSWNPGDEGHRGLPLRIKTWLIRLSRSFQRIPGIFSALPYRVAGSVSILDLVLRR